MKTKRKKSGLVTRRLHKIRRLEAERTELLICIRRVAVALGTAETEPAAVAAHAQVMMLRYQRALSVLGGTADDVAWREKR